MQPRAKTIELARARGAAITLAGLLLMAAVDPAVAAGCSFAPQGEGRVTEIIDARSFRLADGRDVILAGIEPVTSSDSKTNQAAALSAIIAGHDVTLSGNDDMPDRYGRQPAFVFLDSSGTSEQVSVQAQSCARRRTSRSQRDRQGLRRDAGGGRGDGARRQTGNLGRSHRHKKH